MTINKAYRRYPYHTKIKYIGNKIFDPICIRYGLNDMEWCHMPVSNGDIGFVDGFIFDKSNKDVIGVEVRFHIPDKYWNVCRFENVNLYFGEDEFIRSF